MKRCLIFVLLMAGSSMGEIPGLDANDPNSLDRWNVAVAAIRANFAAIDANAMPKDLNNVTLSLAEILSLKDKANLDHVYDVRDYGAVGDGTTDDSTAIQAVIDAVVAAKGGVIYFPTGRYHIHSQLAVKGSSECVVTLQGEGISNPLGNTSVIDCSGLSSGQAAFYYDGSGTNTYLDGRWVFRDLAITGSEADGNPSAVANAFNLNWFYDVSLDHVLIGYCKIGMNLGNQSLGLKVVNSQFMYNGRSIYFKPNATANVIRISYSAFVGDTDPNAIIEVAPKTAGTVNLHKWSIENNWFEAPQYGVLSIPGGVNMQGFAFLNNYIERSCLTGGKYSLNFNTVSPKGLRIEGNTDNSSAPIADVNIGYPEGVIVVGNVFGSTGTTRAMDIGRPIDDVPSIYLSGNAFYADANSNTIKYRGFTRPTSMVAINNNDIPAGLATVDIGNNGTATSIFNAGLVSKNGSTSAGYIDLYEDSDDGTNKVRISTGALPGDQTWTWVGLYTGTFDPNNLAADANDIGTIAATGVALGDFVHPAAPYDLQGITATAYVSATNVVKIKLHNTTTGAVNLASGTWRVKVER